jgi:hypothetical protein
VIFIHLPPVGWKVSRAVLQNLLKLLLKGFFGSCIDCRSSRQVIRGPSWLR